MPATPLTPPISDLAMKCFLCSADRTARFVIDSGLRCVCESCKGTILCPSFASVAWVEKQSPENFEELKRLFKRAPSPTSPTSPSTP